MVYQKIGTMQELRMRINKFQLCPSLTKKLTVKNQKMIFLGTSLNSLEIPTISSAGSYDFDILRKVTLSVSGIMFQERQSAIGQQQKAYSMLIVSVKSFSQHGGFVKAQIKKQFGDKVCPTTILYQDSITS